MSTADIELVDNYYSDSEVVRIELRNLIGRELPGEARIWVDASIDGFHTPFSQQNDLWKNYIHQFPHVETIAQDIFQKSPIKTVVNEFVYSILDLCEEQRPDWITVPCLPQVNDASRNKINRMICDATGNWKVNRRFRGNLILPLIFTHQDQLNSKAARDKKVSLSKSCYERALADGVWIVDSSLDDTDGAQTARTKRFPGIVSLHKELRRALPSNAVHIGGPYWGLNLILWARGLVDYPAVGIGSGYRYLISGGIPRTPSLRVALAPLFRRVLENPELESWLDSSLKKLSPSDPAYGSFSRLKVHLPRLRSYAASKTQVARFYKYWYDSIAKHPAAGRALALFQDLSSAYALGKGLDPLSVAEKSARRPERPAEFFMLMCL